MVEEKIGRRTLLKGVAAAAATAMTPLHLRTAQAADLKGAPAAARDQQAARPPFAAIRPTTEDTLVVPNGYRYDLLAHAGDPMGAGTTFGYNADWIGYYPIDLLQKGFDLSAPQRGYLARGNSSTDGILVVNNEYINPLFLNGYAEEGTKTAEQIVTEQDAVGMSIIRVRRGANGRWTWDPNDTTHNRRISARSTLRMTGPAADIDGGPYVVGTVGNCSGGATPWGTALSCEENFQDYPTEAPDGYGWDAERYGLRHYGWIVEVDPYDATSMPRKHTAMGRFRHENVAIRVGQDGTVVAYMGDDRADCCVYKFVADQKYTNPADRYGNFNILESGKLYAADFGNGRWVLLDYDSQDKLKEATDDEDNPLFTSQADVLTDARAAALALGATPVDRPEDIEIHPLDGSVYIALTNNTGHGNFHGQIVRLRETEDDAAEAFEWSIFATGGPQSGFSSPDNLVFDGAGNLWMVTDISSSRVTSGIYAFQGNNAMFMFPTSGPNAGVAYQFASGPVQCELTGPAWTPDGSTLFLSIQHPGEESESVAAAASRWPDYDPSKAPRPGVVAITGFPRGRV
jgi:hypothetical protein